MKWLALILAALTVGLGLAAAAAATTPWLLILTPLGLLTIALAYRAPVQATAITLLLTPLGLRHLGSTLKVAQALDVLAVLAVVTFRLLRSRTPLPVPRPLLWGAALLAVALLATGTAIDLGLAVKQDLALAVGLGLCAAIAAACDHARKWLTLIRALLIGATLVTAPAVLSGGQLQAKYGGSVVNDRPTGIFAQPNELGAFAMLILLVSLGFVLGAATRPDRALGTLSLLSATAAMLVSLSRGAWIGSIAGIICLLIWLPKARRAVAATALLVAVLGGALGAFAPSSPQVQVITQRLGSLATPKTNPYDDRPRIWREALREISSRPFLGQGPGGFPVASTRSISAAATVQADHAHNVLLTTGAETGLLGLSTLLALTVGCALTVLSGIRTARRQADQQHLCLLTGLAAALAALLGEGTVDMTLRNVVVAQTAWAVLGLALAGAALTHSRQPQADPTALSAKVALPSGRTKP